MSAGMPELGSKISLISKADIRYEGRLFTVDPKECTIALASVRSFGTEDRETPYPVPAQNQVYEYILFRGSDIKDIRVVNNVNPPLNDPAIMQLSVPSMAPQQQFQPHPMLGHMGPQMDLIGGASRSTTPASLGSHKSMTNDQGTQAGGSGKRDDKKQMKPIQAPPRGQQRKSTSQERRGSRGDGPDQHGQRMQNRPQMNRNQYPHPQGYYHHPNNQQGSSNHQQQQQHHQQQHHQRGVGVGGPGGNWVNRGPARLRGRPRGGGTGAFKPNQGQPSQGGKAKNTLKFENDYDFEQANTEFEELRNQLAKVKVEDTPKTEVNGEVDKKEKDDSGNETGAGENEPEEEENREVFYDKSKSFFDKISCEAVERAKGASQRTDWRVERKLNSETFGVSATRRGNFRGRGQGFRGYRGGGYRGGYNRQPQQQQQQRRNDQGDRRGPGGQQNEQGRPNNAHQQPPTVPTVVGK